MLMTNKSFKALLVVSTLCSANVFAQTNEAEILTLFTTQQERELINKNRYNKETVKTNVVVVEKPREEAEKQVVRQKEKISIKLAGVTISQSGQNAAWINGKAYENGGYIGKDIQVYISNKVKSLVQIKTPDGKYHAVVTGKTNEISYLKALGE